jgi:hypothetical protein
LGLLKKNGSTVEPGEAENFCATVLPGTKFNPHKSLEQIPRRWEWELFDEPTGTGCTGQFGWLGLSALLPFLARGITRVSRGFLFGQQTHQLVGFLAFFGLGGGARLLLFAKLAFFFFAVAAFSGFLCEPLFLRPHGSAI